MTQWFAFDARDPLQRNLLIAGVGFNPSNLIGSAPPEHRFGDDGFFEHVVKEFDDMTLGSEEVQVAIDHHAIKGVINELNPGGEECNKELHRRPPLGQAAQG